MRRVKIVTDSGSDIPIDIATELEIDVVPLTITFGDTSYTELTSKTFWEKAAASDVLPQTAAPSTEAFANAFKKAANVGYREILCICLSSDLSATFQNATKAAESTRSDEVSIEVFDSRSATYGEGSLAVYGAQNADLPLGSLLDAVKDLASRTRVFGTLNTLENLRKGGRIGSAAATLGSILSIKPIIEIRNGVVEAHAKQRTRRRALEYIYDLVATEGDRIESISIISAQATDLDEFVARISEITKIKEILISAIGPVIGTHGGEGMIAVCFSTKPN